MVRLLGWHRSVTTPRPPLARGEHVLATEHDAAGALVVATTLAIYHRMADSDGECSPWQRLGWEETGRVSWDPQRHVLDLTGAVPDPYHLELTLADRTRMVALSTERVAASQLAMMRVTLSDGGTAIIQARRQPSSAKVSWVVMLDNATDPHDPDVQARVCAAIRALRIELGLA